MFESLGITATTLAAYKALLENPSVPPADLASLLNLPNDEAEKRLADLRELGLVLPRSWSSKPGEEYAVHPNQGFNLLVEKRRRELARLQDALRQDELDAQSASDQYSAMLRERTANETEILIGQERANQRMQQFLPEISVWGLIPAAFGDAQIPEESPDNPFLERGVEHRYLYTEAHVRTRNGIRFARWLHDRGAKVRCIPSVPMRMVIFDGKSVAMPLDPDDELAGAVVHHSVQVVHLAKNYYEFCWRHAEDLFIGSHSSDAEITAQEAELLNLLVEGATDEQAGRKLGVSLRTVRRMAAKLSEQVGASGRFELGVRAAQRGWVQ
jgi:DNA-binding CsgD family transcriptional regulator/predicted transcriptional regulator